MILSALTLFCADDVFGATQNPTLRGMVVDENGQGIGYVTVVLLSPADSTQVSGIASDGDGVFALTAPADSYLVQFNYLGYARLEREVTLDGDLDMGPVAMMPVSTEAGEVTITARAITREADRFVVNVANSPAAIGKDAFEMLKLSPGVWASSDGISVNGRAGTRIMINDRLIRMSGDELEAYLRTINAQDIARIEIIPDSGADYDADSSGGIIKITLRKQRNDGIDGSVSFNAGVGILNGYYARPSTNINYKSGKFNMYANLGYSHSRSVNEADEETTYHPGSAQPGVITTSADMKGRTNNYNGMFGAFYDINDRHNIGLEMSAYTTGRPNITDGTGTYAYDPPVAMGGLRVDKIESVNRYTTSLDNTYYSGTFNYLYKLDGKGSMFKLIADYVWSGGYNPNTYFSSHTPYFAGEIVGTPIEMYSESTSDADYSVKSLTANFDYIISPKMVIKAGAKYTNNNMYSKMVYMDRDPAGGMNINTGESSITDYTENIAALYAIYSGVFGKFSLSAGLRGEYTFVNPRYRGVAQDGSETDRGNVRQCYFDLFPNVNASYPLNDSRSTSLVLAISRRIARPDFNYLSPFRNPLSDYSVVIGNPDLKATYANSFSLSGVFAYKYNITIGASLMENQIMQKVLYEEGSDVLIYQFVNIPRTWQYYAALNAPVTFTKWWNGNFNLTLGDLRQQLDADSPVKHKIFGMLYANMTFSLPAGFDIEVGGYAMSRILNANMEVMPMGNMNVGVKKRFADNKFTASLGMNNIFNVRQEVYSYGPGFDKWAYLTNFGNMMINFSLRYNFQSGQKFRARQIERGSEEDVQRIGKAQ